MTITRLPLMLLATAGIAAAQPQSGAVEAEQIGPAAKARTVLAENVEQGQGARASSAQAPEQLNNQRGEAEASQQVSAPAQSSGPVPQLSTRGDRRQSPQLYVGGRTAQSAPALSDPREGRTSAVTRVEGSDRCDPRARSTASSEACEHVIETRSAEFTRPDPALLSPEQRLLVEQRNRPMASERAAAQRLATNVSNPDELPDQAVASQALLTEAQPAKAPEGQPALPAELDAIVQGVINAVVQPQ